MNGDLPRGNPVGLGQRPSIHLAACATAGSDSMLQNAQTSASRDATCSGGGGTGLRDGYARTSQGV